MAVIEKLADALRPDNRARAWQPWIYSASHKNTGTVLIIVTRRLGSTFAVLAGFPMFVLLVWRTLAAGRHCPANPWGKRGTTLRWTLPSPPPLHTFDELPDLTGEGKVSSGAGLRNKLESGGLS